MDDHNLFGHTLKKLREKRDLTQPELAALVPVSLDALKSYEQGRRRPTKETAYALARVLDIPDKELDDFVNLARGRPLNKKGPSFLVSLVSNRDKGEVQEDQIVIVPQAGGLQTELLPGSLDTLKRDEEGRSHPPGETTSSVSNSEEVKKDQAAFAPQTTDEQRRTRTHHSSHRMIVVIIVLVMATGMTVWLVRLWLVQSAPPGALIIPAVNSASRTVTIDGRCEEYSQATAQSFNDYDNTPGAIYLMHDRDRLYVCAEFPHGHFSERRVDVYLSRNYDRQGFAQADDYALGLVLQTSAQLSRVGSGRGNYIPVSHLDGLWSGVAAVRQQHEVAEYSISLDEGLTNRCEVLFRIAVFHKWVRDYEDDWGWPLSRWYDQPSSWQLGYIKRAFICI